MDRAVDLQRPTEILEVDPPTSGAQRRLPRRQAATLAHQPGFRAPLGQPGLDLPLVVRTWLPEEGSKPRLVVEDRGLPTRDLPFHAAGWRVHLEDLGRSLEVDGPVHPEGWSSDAGAPGWKARWEELMPAYQQMEIG